MVIVRRSGSAALLALLWLLGACTPTCDQACKKLMRCEGLETEGLYADRCEEGCEEEKALYEDWENPQLEDALDAELRCIRDETCEAIADGACYDEDLYAF